MSVREEVEIELRADTQKLKNDLGYAQRLVIQYTDTVQASMKRLTKESKKASRAQTAELKKISNQMRINTQKQTAYFKSLKSHANKTNKTLESVHFSLVDMGVQLAAYFGYQAVSGIIRMADAWNLVNDRIKLVSDDYEAFQSNQKEVLAIANRSRVTYNGVADTFARIARNTQRLNITDMDRLKVTEAISKSLIISGATTLSAHGALVQFGQGLAANALRGQELNSVMEQTPRLSQAIADGMGVAIGDLRKMAEQGLLTSEVLVEALKGQLDAINSEFAGISPTIGQSFVVFNNNLKYFVGQLDDATQGSDRFSKTLKGLADSMDKEGSRIENSWVYKTIIGFEKLNNLVDFFWQSFKLGMQAGAAGMSYLVERFKSGWDLLGAQVGIVVVKMKQYFNDFKIFAIGVLAAVFEKIPGMDKTAAAFKRSVENAKQYSSDLMDAEYNAYVKEADILKRRKEEKKALADFMKKDLKGQAVIVTASAVLANKTMAQLDADHQALRKANDLKKSEYNRMKADAVKSLEDAVGVAREKKKIIVQEIAALNRASIGTDDRVEGSLAGNLGMQAALKQVKDLKKRIDDLYKSVSVADKKGLKIKVDLAFEAAGSRGVKSSVKAYAEEIALQKTRMRGWLVDSDSIDALDEYRDKAIAAAESVYALGEQSENAHQQALERIDQAYERAKKTTNELGQIAETVGTKLENAFMDSIRSMMDGAVDFKDMFMSLLKDIAAEIIRVMVVKQLASSVSGYIGSFAQGGAFEGGVQKFATGGIVNSPTYFPMAGSTGLMGEAGPEAIMPLTRMGNGDLGVQAVPSNGLQNVTISIVNESGQEMEVTGGGVESDMSGYIINVVVDALHTNKGGMRTAIGR